jgi:3-dehydroquinate dehydratase
MSPQEWYNLNVANSPGETQLDASVSQPQANVSYRITSVGDLLAWGVIVNLLTVRFLRPIMPFLSFVSFRAWIDWVLLAYILFSRGRSTIRPLFLPLTLTAAAIALNLGLYGINSLALISAITILTSFVVPIFLSSYAGQLGARKDRFLARVHRTLNWYFFLNTPLVIGQIYGVVPTPSAFLSINPSAFDHWSGLIGLNGVSTLNFVWLSTITANIWASEAFAARRYLAIAAVQLAVCGWISTLNDNKMFVPMAAVGVAFIVAVKVQTTLKRASLIVLAPIAAYVMYSLTATTFTSSSGRTLDVMDVLIYNPDHLPNPENERAFLNFLAFSRYNGNGSGSGLSFVNPNADTIHVHLGINSASLLLIQGGLMLLIPVLVLLTATFVLAIPIIDRPLASRIVIWVAAFLFAVAATYASSPVEDRYNMTAIGLFLLFLASPARGCLREQRGKSRTAIRRTTQGGSLSQ